MTAAEQKQFFAKVLALPKRARVHLLERLIESLDESEDKISRKEWNRLWKAELDRRVKDMESGKDEGIPLDQVLAEVSAVYGRTKSAKPASVPRASKRAARAVPKEEALSQKEWDKAWKAELETRNAEIDSGKVKCVPYAVARKRWDKIIGRA